jgi:nuclear transport factor 2 (NTF2) superfamily protein
MPVNQTIAITEADARSIVAEAEAAFMAADVPRILSLFTPDIVVRYADFPEMRGLDALENFLRMRFARQKNYRLRKTFRTVTGNTIGDSWEGQWEDTKTGKKMMGRGLEFLTISEGKAAIWEATFNVWEADGGPTTPLL